MSAAGLASNSGWEPVADLASERGVLCSILLDGEVVEQLTGILAPSDFHRTANRLIYEAAIALHSRGEPVLAASVVGELKAAGTLDRAHGSEYLGELLREVDSPAHATYFAQRVREAARVRGLHATFAELDRIARGGAVSSEAILALATQKMEEHSALQGIGAAGDTWRTFDQIAEAAAMNPREWLVDGLIPKQGPLLLIGLPKVAGKSTLAWALVAAAARGGEFLGQQLEPMRSVILAEDGEHDLAERIERFGLRGTEGRVLSRASVRGVPEFGAVVAEATKTAHAIGAKILLIDTWAFWADLEDGAENDAGATTRAMRHVLRAADSGLLVLVVHHTGKGFGLDGGSRARGSTALPASVDATFDIRSASGRQRKIRVETRYAGVREIVVELVQTDETPPTYVLVGDAPALAGEQVEGRILDFLRSRRGEAFTTKEMKDSIPGRAAEIGKALGRLAAAGRVERSGSRKRGDPYRYAALGSAGRGPVDSGESAPCVSIPDSQRFPLVPRTPQSVAEDSVPGFPPSLEGEPGLESDSDSGAEMREAQTWDCPRCGLVDPATWKARGCGSCRLKVESE